MKTEKTISINVAEHEYVHAVFDALMNFQTIEELLKKCILDSYDILEKTCPGELQFRPSKRDIKRIKNGLGLGGLVSKFEEVIPNKELCEKIRNATKARNELAHKAAANYLQFPISSDGAESTMLKANEYREASDIARALYNELYGVYEKIMEVHGEKV